MYTRVFNSFLVVNSTFSAVYKEISSLAFTSSLVAKFSKSLKLAFEFTSSFVARLSKFDKSTFVKSSSLVARTFKSLFKAYVSKLATKLL